MTDRPRPTRPDPTRTRDLSAATTRLSAHPCQSPSVSTRISVRLCPSLPIPVRPCPSLYSLSIYVRFCPSLSVSVRLCSSDRCRLVSCHSLSMHCLCNSLSVSVRLYPSLSVSVPLRPSHPSLPVPPLPSPLGCRGPWERRLAWPTSLTRPDWVRFARFASVQRCVSNHSRSSSTTTARTRPPASVCLSVCPSVWPLRDESERVTKLSLLFLTVPDSSFSRPVVVMCLLSHGFALVSGCRLKGLVCWSPSGDGPLVPPAEDHCGPF